MRCFKKGNKKYYVYLWHDEATREKVEKIKGENKLSEEKFVLVSKHGKFPLIFITCEEELFGEDED